MATSEADSPDVISGSSQHERNPDKNNPGYVAPQPPGSDSNQQIPLRSVFGTRTAPALGVQLERVMTFLGTPVCGRGKHLTVNTSASDALLWNKQNMRKTNDSQSENFEEISEEKKDATADSKTGNQEKQGIKQDTVEKCTSGK